MKLIQALSLTLFAKGISSMDHEMGNDGMVSGDGMIHSWGQSTDMCIYAKSNKAKARLGMGACDDASKMALMMWTMNAEGQIMLVGTNWCWSTRYTNKKSAIRLSECDNTKDTQKFGFDMYSYKLGLVNANPAKGSLCVQHTKKMMFTWCSYTHWGSYYTTEDYGTTMEIPTTDAPEPCDSEGIFGSGWCDVEFDKIVKTIDTSEHFKLEFDIHFMSANPVNLPSYRSIIHIGDVNGQRWPGIWLHPGEEFEVYVRLTQCNGFAGGQTGPNQVPGPAIPITAGTMIHFALVVGDDNGTLYSEVFWNGVSVGRFPANSCGTATDVNVYAGQSDYPAADVQLKNTVYTPL